jgi:hypothetical protein
MTSTSRLLPSGPVVSFRSNDLQTNRLRSIKSSFAVRGGAFFSFVAWRVSERCYSLASLHREFRSDAIVYSRSLAVQSDAFSSFRCVESFGAMLSLAFVA